MADAMSMRLAGDIGDSVRAFADRIRAQQRPAAYVAANMLYEEMRMRAPVLGVGHWFHGSSYKKTGQKYWLEAGALRNSIYHWYDEKRSVNGRHIYVIGPNRQKAPHWAYVEYGTVKAAPRPYIRPAYDSRINQAMDAAKAKLAEGIGGKS